MSNNYPYYPRKKRGGLWLVVIIIVIAAIIYANSKGIINLGSINLGNLSLGSSNSSVQSCIQKVTNCGNSNGYNLTVLSNTEAQNSGDANTFLMKWKGAQSGNISDYGVISYPISLVAASSNGVLHVFVCKSDGTLSTQTNLGIC